MSPHEGPRDETRHFWHVRHDSSVAAGALLEAATSLDPRIVVCRSTDAARPTEAWMETWPDWPGVDTTRDLLTTMGWDIVDVRTGRILTELVNPATVETPTHRLYFHYVTDATAMARLDAWYAEEHEEMLLRSPAWHRIRRFLTQEPGTDAGRLVVHDITDPMVLSSEELRVAMATPWREELSRLDWFMRSTRAPWEILAASPTQTSGL